MSGRQGVSVPADMAQLHLSDETKTIIMLEPLGKQKYPRGIDGVWLSSE